MAYKSHISSSAFKNNAPLISVIIVVYNAENELEETLISVVNQKYSTIELIVIDGGSTDGTLKILEKYNSKITFWKSEPDKGIYDAMNKAVKIAKGDWIYFLGAGDILFNVLHEIADNLLDPSYIYYGDVYRKDLHKIYDGEFTSFKLAVNNICHQAIFYPAIVFKKYHFETRYKALADHNLNMQCFGDKEIHFSYLPKLLSIYEGEGFSKVNSVDHEFFRDKIKIIQKNFSFTVYCYARLRRFIGKILKG